jgi:hypothetical protein
MATAPRPTDDDVDEIAVERAARGERLPLNAAERQAVTDLLTRRGKSIPTWINSRYYEGHKAEAAEYQRRYREGHKAEAAEYQRRYREGHKAEAAEYQRRYREGHKAEAAERQRRV